MTGLPGAAGPLCSAKGCRNVAVWVLAWNNPRLHPPERRKTWAACDEHREHLSAFLNARGFLRETLTVAEWRALDNGAAGPGSPA